MAGNVKFLVMSDGFLSAPVQAVAAVTRTHKDRRLASSIFLTITESQLYTRCVAWAKQECGRTEREVSPLNIRLVMASFMKNFNFADADVAAARFACGLD